MDNGKQARGARFYAQAQAEAARMDAEAAGRGIPLANVEVQPNQPNFIVHRNHMVERSPLGGFPGAENRINTIADEWAQNGVGELRNRGDMTGFENVGHIVINNRNGLRLFYTTNRNNIYFLAAGNYHDRDNDLRAAINHARQDYNLE